jgi:hypothetical protein
VDPETERFFAAEKKENKKQKNRFGPKTKTKTTINRGQIDLKDC